MLWIMLGLLALGAVVAVAVGDQGTLGGMDGGMIAALVASIALLVFIGAPFLASQRGRWSKSLQEFAVWVSLILVLVLGYSFRDDFRGLYQRLAGELMPPGQTLSVTDDVDGRKAVRIRRQPNGHFTARAAINGHSMQMLVDTGASSVVLKASDARRAGIDVERLSFTVPVRTANGVAYAAATEISSISIGSIEMHNLSIMVAKPGALGSNLLGMNFLTQLRSYEFTGDFLTLRG